jgi:hypothetical protein
MPNLPSGYQEPPTFEDVERENHKRLASQIAELEVLLLPRHIDEWREDIGPVLWWTSPVWEAPYVGSPLDCGRSFAVEIADGITLAVKDAPGTGWPGYHEWWTPLPNNDLIGLIQSRIADAIKAREVKA